MHQFIDVYLFLSAIAVFHRVTSRSVHCVTRIARSTRQGSSLGAGECAGIVGIGRSVCMSGLSALRETMFLLDVYDLRCFKVTNNHNETQALVGP